MLIAISSIEIKSDSLSVFLIFILNNNLRRVDLAYSKKNPCYTNSLYSKYKPRFKNSETKFQIILFSKESMPRTHLNDHLFNLSHIRTKETKTKKYSFNEPYEAPGFKTNKQTFILKGSIFIQIIFLKY